MFPTHFQLFLISLLPAATSMTAIPKSIPFSSPFYLHPSDHTGLNICLVTMKSNNYDEWVTAMSNSLMARRKLGFINGTIKKPDDDATDPPTLDDWRMVNAMLVGWIVQSIDLSLRSSLTYFDTAKALWDDLRQRFSVGNGPRKAQLRADLSQCRQGGLSVAAYFNHIKKLWEELAQHTKHKSCTCGKCTCDLNSTWTKEQEEEKIHQFLIGLNEHFRTLRSNVLAQEPLPPLNRVYSLAIQEEFFSAATLTRDTTESMALAARRFVPQSSMPNPTVPSIPLSPPSSSAQVCAHCGRTGHTKNTCYRLHGYPSWLQTKMDARKPKSRPAGGVHAVQAPPASTSATDLTVKDQAAFGPALTNEQWTAVMSMYNSMQEPNKSGTSFEDGDWRG